MIERKSYSSRSDEDGQWIIENRKWNWIIFEKNWWGCSWFDIFAWFYQFKKCFNSSKLPKNQKTLHNSQLFGVLYFELWFKQFNEFRILGWSILSILREKFLCMYSGIHGNMIRQRTGQLGAKRDNVYGHGQRYVESWANQQPKHFINIETTFHNDNQWKTVSHHSVSDNNLI